MDVTHEGTGRPDGEPRGPGRRSGRTGRRAGPTETRGDIIRAARKLFAENGYNGTTMRTIAFEAGVDAALIHHFFASKNKVFVATVQDVFRDVQAIDGPPELAGELLVREFLRLWEDDSEAAESLRAIFSSALSYDEAARLLGDIVAVQLVAPVVAESGAGDGPLCTTLLSSQLVGVALMRYVVKAEPLASANTEVLAKTLGLYFQKFLDGDTYPHPAITMPDLPPLA
jgi:AcrR family transcriptional regulator